MQILALITQKGGAGKSTLAQHLAASACADGRRALLIDADPQGSAEQWYETRERNDAPQVVTIRPAELSKALELAAKQFDLVVIDTPGREAGHLVDDIVRAADLCLLPSRPTSKDIKAQKPTVATVKKHGTPAAFILTHCPKAGARADAARNALSSAYELPVVPEIIPHRVGYADADVLGLTIGEHEPEGKGAAEIAALWAWTKARLDRPRTSLTSSKQEQPQEIAAHG